MATEFEIQCALMAGRVYLTTRDKVNWFPVPDGWGEFFHIVNRGQTTVFWAGMKS